MITIDWNPTHRFLRQFAALFVVFFAAIGAFRFFYRDDLAMASVLWTIAPLGLVGLYMRLRLDESPAFQALKAQHAVPQAPLKETVRTHGATIVSLSAFISVTALSFYMFTTYFTTYMQVVGEASRTTAFPRKENETLLPPPLMLAPFK